MYCNICHTKLEDNKCPTCKTKFGNIPCDICGKNINPIDMRDHRLVCKLQLDNKRLRESITNALNTDISTPNGISELEGILKQALTDKE
jgi:methionyl-tRNA synthetase